MIFHWGRPKAESSWGTITPHQLGGLGSPSGFPTAQGFPLFPALRMASRDTVILLIVDNHAAIGARPPWPPCIRPWLALKLWLTLRLVFCLRKRNLLESISSERSRYVTSRSLWMQPMPFAKKRCLIYTTKDIIPRESKKTGHLILAHRFGKMLTDFQNSSTVGLSSDCVTHWSLKSSWRCFV